MTSFTPYAVQILNQTSCDITPTGYGWNLVENAPYPLQVAVSRSAGLDNCGMLSYEGQIGEEPILHHIPSPGTQCQLETFPLSRIPPGAAAPGPGPSPSPRLWLRADAGITLNLSLWTDRSGYDARAYLPTTLSGGKVSFWADQSGYDAHSDLPTTWSGGRVSFWADQSGYDTHADMPTATRQPALVHNALNGLPAIRFGGAQSLVLQRPVSPRTFTIFVVGKNSNLAEDFSMILGPSGNWANNQLRWDSGSRALFVGTGNNLPIITSPIGNTRVYHVLSARFNGSRMQVFRDGNLISTHNFTTTGPWTLAQIGAWYSSYFMVGDLAELLLYSTSLSDADHTHTSAYLRARYALP